MSEKVTAGRDYLGGFAPEFAAFNDDILFGKVWAKEDNLPPFCMWKRYPSPRAQHRLSETDVHFGNVT